MKIFFETKAVLGNRLNDVKCLIENYCMEAALRNWNAFTVIWIYSWMYVTSILFEESSSPKFFKKIISIFFVLKKKWHVRLSCQRPQAAGVAERGGGWLNIETGTHTQVCSLWVINTLETDPPIFETNKFILFCEFYSNLNDSAVFSVNLWPTVNFNRIELKTLLIESVKSYRMMCKSMKFD